MSQHRQPSSPDERELQFDRRCLGSGDELELFIESERKWAPGKLEVSTTGIAFIRLRNGRRIPLCSALLMGLRRPLN